jgi:hypothetical protein
LLAIVRVDLQHLRTLQVVATLPLEIFMISWRAEDRLYLRLGTETPNWYLAADSDTLFLAAAGTEERVAIRLDAAQVSRIRMTTGHCVRTTLTVTVLGARLRLHLVGWKVNDYMWKGVASGDVNFPHAAPRALSLVNPLDALESGRK